MVRIGFYSWYSCFRVFVKIKIDIWLLHSSCKFVRSWLLNVFYLITIALFSYSQWHAFSANNTIDVFVWPVGGLCLPLSFPPLLSRFSHWIFMNCLPDIRLIKRVQYVRLSVKWSKVNVTWFVRIIYQVRTVTVGQRRWRTAVSHLPTWRPPKQANKARPSLVFYNRHTLT